MNENSFIVDLIFSDVFLSLCLFTYPTFKEVKDGPIKKVKVEEAPPSAKNIITEMNQEDDVKSDVESDIDNVIDDDEAEIQVFLAF